MNTYRIIEEALENLETSDLLDVFREYCEDNSYYDDLFYSMDEFDEIMNGVEPWEAVRMAFYGDFRPADRYFRFNGYGNLESTDYPEDWVEEHDLAAWLEEVGLDTLPGYLEAALLKEIEEIEDAA